PLLTGRRRGVAATRQAVGIALLLLIAVPWFAYVYRQVPNALALWRYESIGEISDNEEKARPWWLYLGSTFRLPLPWTPLWIAGIALVFIHGKRELRSPRGRRRLVPILWYASNLLFFSMLNVKKDAYLLPALGAMVLTIADALILIALLGFERPDTSNARSPRQFCAGVVALMRATELPILVGKLPEEAAFYLPLDLPNGEDSSRTLAIVDDNRLEIERGKK